MKEEFGRSHIGVCKVCAVKRSCDADSMMNYVIYDCVEHTEQIKRTVRAMKMAKDELVDDDPEDYEIITTTSLQMKGTEERMRR